MADKKTITKKFFYGVKAPLTAVKISLYAGSAQELDGRVVRVDLTRSLRGKSLELRLRIRAEGEVLTAEPLSLTLAGSYIRKMIRKGSDYVEDSFVSECRDGKAVVKPYFITRNKVSRALRKALREHARKYLEVYLKTRTMKEIFSDIMANKIQKELSLKLKKIYPLALCEVRWFEVVGMKAQAEEKPELK